MTTSIYCLYVGFDYTYIDVNALAQGIKSFLASLVWSQAVADRIIFLSFKVVERSNTSTFICMYVCMNVCMYACIYFVVVYFYTLVISVLCFVIILSNGFYCLYVIVDIIIIVCFMIYIFIYSMHFFY